MAAFANYPMVSVIIPVFNDEERLQRCLAALANQSYAADRIEIIVVDNGSDYPDGVKRAVAPFSRVALALEPKPGSYAARNRGLVIAQGDIIAFTDADCIPAEDWLEQGVCCLLEPPGYDMVVGQIEVFPQQADRPTLIELYQMMTTFPQETYLQQFKGGATANLLTRRSVLDRVGNFNDRLKSSGDLEWGSRVFAAGYRQRYAAAVQVQHPALATWADLHRKTARVAGGVYDRFVKPDDTWLQRNKMFGRLMLDDLLPPKRLLFAVLSDSRFGGFGQRLGVLAVMLWLRLLSAWEKTRIHLGGKSKRR